LASGSSRPLGFRTVYDLDPATPGNVFHRSIGFTSIFGVFAKSGGTVWLDENRPERSA